MDKKVKELRERIGVGTSVASELLILSGGDIELTVEESRKAEGLDQCKAGIINARFRRIEEKIS